MVGWARVQKTISWEIVEVVWWLGREGRDEVVVVVEEGEGEDWGVREEGKEGEEGGRAESEASERCLAGG